MTMGIFHLMVWASLLATGAVAQESSADILELAGRNADFAARLYRKIASSSDSNLVFSPLGVSLGLASLAAGAGGDTRVQILQSLGLAPMERDGQPERVPELLLKLRETVSQNQVTAIAASQQTQVEAAFSDQVKKYYGTDVQSVNFGDAQAAKTRINNYVRSSTGEKIREVVSAVDPQTQLMLISAAFFKGQWQLPFNASFTADERFYVDKYHIKQVSMMFRSDKYYLAYDPSLKVGILKLPCSDGAAMLILLPDEDVDYTSIDEEVTGERFLGWVKQLRKTKLEVQLPRFSLEQSYSLKRSLPSLGITAIFEDNADLSGLSKEQGLRLSEVLHKASIEVEETGATGAGAGNSLFTSSLPPRLTINRPFLFLVYHEATTNLLFMGRVVDPTNK